MVADHRVEGHVWRIADDKVYLAVQLVEAVGDVAMMQRHALSGSVRCVDVAFRPADRGIVDLNGVNV